MLNKVVGVCMMDRRKIGFNKKQKNVLEVITYPFDSVQGQRSIWNCTLVLLVCSLTVIGLYVGLYTLGYNLSQSYKDRDNIYLSRGGLKLFHVLETNDIICYWKYFHHWTVVSVMSLNKFSIYIQFQKIIVKTGVTF